MSIVVENLAKSFDGQPAVNDVSIDVPGNAFFCVVGPSGCGKSTLLRLIAGLETLDAGRIILNGTPVAGPDLMLPPEDRRVGVVFQSYALWPHLSVAKNVAFPYEARGFTAAKAMALAGEHIRAVELSDLADRRPEALSGGQRQRVALARCLAGEAQTILMDEPLANLDPHLRGAMETELRAFHDRSGVTTLYITHDQREAMALADVMAVMDAGRILQIGSPQDIYERPSCETVARFIGRGSVIKADVTGTEARIGDQRFPVDGANGNGQQTVFLRPQNINLTTEGLPVEITSIHYRGGVWDATAHGSNGEVLLLDLPKAARIGEQVQVTFKGGWVLSKP